MNFVRPEVLDFVPPNVTDSDAPVVSVPTATSAVDVDMDEEKEWDDEEEERSRGQDAKLAFTHPNASLHAYAESLLRLLNKLDAVESGGDRKVRERRREVVRRIESEAEGVERWWRGVWRAYVGKRRREEGTKEGEGEAKEVEMNDEENLMEQKKDVEMKDAATAEAEMKEVKATVPASDEGFAEGQESDEGFTEGEMDTVMPSEEATAGVEASGSPEEQRSTNVDESAPSPIEVDGPSTTASASDTASSKPLDSAVKSELAPIDVNAPPASANDTITSSAGDDSAPIDVDPETPAAAPTNDTTSDAASIDVDGPDSTPAIDTDSAATPIDTESNPDIDISVAATIDSSSTIDPADVDFEVDGDGDGSVTPVDATTDDEEYEWIDDASSTHGGDDGDNSLSYANVKKMNASDPSSARKVQCRGMVKKEKVRGRRAGSRVRMRDPELVNLKSPRVRSGSRSVKSRSKSKERGRK